MTDWNDKEQVLKAVSISAFELENASKKLKADREITMTAVQNYGDALQYASDELRADPKVIAAAVKQDRTGVEFALKTIKNKVLKGLSNKDDGGQIASVNFWDIDEEGKKDIEEYIFNNPELAKKYFSTLCFEELESYFFRDDDKDYALPDNIKENYDNSITYVNHIQSSILDAAFSGKLVN